MKTAIITCLFVLAAGIATAQTTTHPSRRNVQHVNANQASDKPASENTEATPAPAPQPENRSINEKGLSTPVNSSAPKKQNAATTPAATDKKEEKMQARPQE